MTTAAPTPSGRPSPVDRYANVRTEVELVFVLAKDLEPEATSLHNALGGISYVESALEVLDSASRRRDGPSSTSSRTMQLSAVSSWAGRRHVRIK